MVALSVIRNNFTYEFWVKPSKTHQNDKASINRRFVIRPKHTGVLSQSEAGVLVDTNGIHIVEANTDYLPAALVERTDLTDWTHIAIVYRDKRPFLYINGNFVKEGMQSTQQTVFASGTINRLNFAGNIRGLRIWDHAKDEDQISYYRNKVLTRDMKGLYLNWHGDLEDKITVRERNHVQERKKDTKLIAFYLPQFHETPENNRWWGKGFTEWTNTRKAKPLFNGHYQPREPYRDFYYDLTDPRVREWQANLAKTYGIYGFCYYHYWFNGKRLLEKPFDAVLASGKPDFPFCLSWANESWTRKWDGGSKDVIMPQHYGGEKDWEAHFNYLLNAFQDERYIRIDDKPLFIIYRPEVIPNLTKMLDYWDTLAKQNGLKGIYFVQTFNGFRPLKPNKRFDAAVEFEPHFTLAHGNCTNPWKQMDGYAGKKKILDYDNIWSCMLNRNRIQHKKVFLGAFNDWDNTARMRQAGTVYNGANPSKFESYLSRQIQRASNVYTSEFVFINAWNEWAEGAYLEPDKRFKYQYLEAVRNALRANHQ